MSIIEHSQRFAARSSVLNQVCEHVRLMQDLERSARPLVKVAEEELLRANKHHTPLHSKIDTEAHTVADDIDRVVRSCMQQTSIQSLKSEHNLSKTSSAQQSRGVSYDEWKRRKEAEAKLKKQLGNEVVKEVQEKQREELDERRAKEAYSKQLYDEWLENKRQDEADRKHRELIEKQQKQEAELQRREEANTKYKEWLRDNYIKLTENKRLEYEAKLRTRQKQHEEAAHAANRRRLAEATFFSWLSRKNQGGPPVSKKSLREEHKSPHLPFLLAYSPNRKRNDTPSEIDYEDYEDSISLVQDQRARRGGDRMHYSRDSHLDEISSIRRNPMLLEQMQSIDDTESITEDENEEDEYDDDLEDDEDIDDEELEDEGEADNYEDLEYDDDFISMSEDY